MAHNTTYENRTQNILETTTGPSILLNENYAARCITKTTLRKF
jgi:hypothetical protein